MKTIQEQICDALEEEKTLNIIQALPSFIITLAVSMIVLSNLVEAVKESGLYDR